MGKHAPRRAHVVFTEAVEQEIECLTDTEYARLDRALVEVSVNPLIGDRLEHVTALRQYTQSGATVVYFSTTLGSVVVVAHLEAETRRRATLLIPAQATDER